MTEPSTSQPAADTRNASIIELSLIAVGIGIVTGLGAILLRYLIAILHNFFFLGIFSFDYDANLPTPPSPYGPLVILAPVVGGVIVLWLVRTFAPEAKGHGVPEVMDAIYYRGGDDHWNASGQDLAAQLVANALITSGLLP